MASEVVELCSAAEDQIVVVAESAQKDAKKWGKLVIALTKALDILADYVLVEMVYTTTDGFDGCSNECEYARNGVCQDGVKLERDWIVCGFAKTCSSSVEPAACSYGADCRDCGPREPLGDETFSQTIRLIAWAIAIVATLVEVWAGYKQWLLLYKEKEKLSGPLYRLRSLQLSKTIAWVRFFGDDLGATLLSLYILVAFPNAATGSALGLLVISVVCSALALMFHLCRSLEEDVEGYKQLREAEGMTAAEMKAEGVSVVELKAAGYTAQELKAAGFDASALKAAGFDARALQAAGFDAKALKDEL